MREILYINIDNYGYGIWTDEIESIRENCHIHHLPLISKIFAGITEFDGKFVTIADLPACIGLQPVKERSCHLLILSDSRDMAGFAVEQKIIHYEIAPDKIFKLPAYLQSKIIDTCVIYSANPIPVINIKSLAALLNCGDYSPGKIDYNKIDLNPCDMTNLKSLRRLVIGEESFAIPEINIIDKIKAPDKFTANVLFPEFVKGIALHKDGILPIVSLSKRMAMKNTGSEKNALIADIGDNILGLLADSADDMPQDRAPLFKMPPIVRSSWMREAIITGGEIIPVLDPNMLILWGKEDDKKSPESCYNPDLRFEREFGKNDIEVVEFNILNSLYSLPESEVRDIIPIKQIRNLPDVTPVVTGVAEHEGELLPVLDLALYFGIYSETTSDWKMILVESGDFRAFVITKQTNKNKKIPSSALSRLPIKLPYNLVYGCYPDSESGAMIILNVESMAVHFDKENVREYFHAIFNEKIYANTVLPIPYAARASEKETLVPEESLPAREEPQKETNAASPVSAVYPEEEKISTAGNSNMNDSEPETTAADISQSIEKTPEAAEEAGPVEPVKEEIPVLQAFTDGNLADIIYNIKPSAEEKKADDEIFPAETVPAALTDKIMENPMPARAIPKAGVPVKNPYTYAAAGLLIIIIIFLLGAFFLSEKAPVEKNEMSSAGPEKNAPADSTPHVLDKGTDKTGVTEPVKTPAAEKTIQADQERAGTNAGELKDGASGYITYEVIKGDELYYITEKFTGNGWDYWTIARENKIENPDLIFPEQKINVKKEYIKK